MYLSQHQAIDLTLLHILVLINEDLVEINPLLTAAMSTIAAVPKMAAQAPCLHGFISDYVSPLTCYSISLDACGQLQWHQDERLWDIRDRGIFLKQEVVPTR